MNKYILISLAILLATACSNEERIIPSDTSKEVRVSAGAKSYARIVMSNQGNYTRSLWRSGDKISLFTATQSNLVYSTTLPQDSAYAEFTPVSEKIQYIEGNKVYASYPETTATTENGMVVNLPSTQTVEYNNGNIPSFGYAVSNISKGSVNFTFKHISAFICLTLSPDMLASASSNVIGSISVSTTSSTPLSVGEGDTFDFSTLTANTTNGNNTVQINAINHTLTENWTVYIPILPQPADATLTITVTGSDGSTLYTLSKAAPATGFLAGNAYQLNLNGSTTPEVGSRQLVGAYLTYNYEWGDRWNEDWTISYNADGKVDRVDCLVIDSIYGNENQQVTFEYSDDGKSLKATFTDGSEYGYTITATLNDMGYFENLFSKYATDDETGETFLFEYNNMGQLTRHEESGLVFTMEYDSNNNAIKCVDEDKYKTDVTTNNIVYSSVENKGNILLIDMMYGSDVEDHLEPYSLLGFFGNSSTHLPIQINMTNSYDSTIYTTDLEWTIDEEGYPIKLIVKDNDGTHSVVFTWSSESR